MGRNTVARRAAAEKGARREGAAGFLGRLTEAYVIFFVVAFPLFVHDKYFDIMNDKFYLFWVSCALLSCMAALAGLVYLFSDINKNHGKGAAAFFRGFVPSRLWKGLSLPDRFFLAFMAISILSTALSRYPYEAFWGQYGRYQGMFLWIFYGLLYVLISRFYRIRQGHIDLFLFIGALLSLWGCLDYLGFDIFGWRGLIDDPVFRYDFSSGIGNINSLTAMIAMYMSVSAVLFISQETGSRSGMLRKICYGISLFINFTAMVMGSSDNAILAIGVLLYCLPFFAWKKRSGALYYVLTLALFLLSIYLSGVATDLVLGLNAEALATGGSLGFDIMPQNKWGLLLNIADTHRDKVGLLLVLCLFVAAFIYFLYFSGYKKEGSSRLQPLSFEEYLSEPLFKRPIYIWTGLGAAGVLGIIWLFYDANTGGHPEWYAPYRNIFIFDDRWGHNRGFNWKLLLGYFAGFPLIMKLIGAGPETYGVYTGTRDYYTMLETTNETYDSPHNEFLQYLVSLGILGFIAYYGTIASAVIAGIAGGSRARSTVFSAACAFAVLAYTASSFINISAPTVTPMMMLLLSMCVGETYREAAQAEG